MSIAVTPGVLELELVFGQDPSDDGQYHGCHVECQLDAERPTMACGALSVWHRMLNHSDLPKCPGCWGENVYCPICGVKLAAS